MNVLNVILEPPFPAFNLIPIGISGSDIKLEPRSAKEILDSLFDGILWDTPKHRRPVEERLRRKFGNPNFKPHGWKMIDRKTDIVTCLTCGNFRQRQYLCEHCYERIKEETDQICEAMLKAQGYDPIEKEVTIRYKDESKDGVQNAQMVEVDRERPSWFSKNLLSRVNRKPTSANVTELEEINRKN